MAFRRSTPVVTDNYGTPTTRSDRLHRPAIIANHVLHWASSLIVLGISAYFIRNYSNNTHLVYWLSIAAIDALLYLPALVLPAMRTYKGYLAPVAWIFSYLWLTAFIFAAQDYNFNNCAINSPGPYVNKCAMKKTLEAFAFLAFFTNIVGTILEGRLWDINRFKGNNTIGSKHGAAPVTDQTTTAPHIGSSAV